MNYHLYDSELHVRYKATCEYVANGNAMKDKWERGCWGSLNGWIMLVGPSPGKADSTDDQWSGGADIERPKDEISTISKHAGIINFPSNQARNKKWTNLIVDFVKERDYAEALTTVCNLDWGHNPDQRKIAAKDLRAGCPVVFDKIVKTKPMIVAAMTVSVWEILLVHFTTICSPASQYAYIVPLSYETSLKRKPLLVKIRDNDHPFLFIKVSHPSRPIPAIERQEYRNISDYLRNHRHLE